MGNSANVAKSWQALAASVAVTGSLVGVGAWAMADEDDVQAGADAQTVTPHVSVSPKVSSGDVQADLRGRADSVDRADGVSRGGSRPALAAYQRATKSRALPVAGQNSSSGVTRTVAAPQPKPPPPPPSDPRQLAAGMLADYGWGSDQFSCLDQLYIHESGWNPAAENSSSGAFGIPQALPGDKMASAGADWRTNAATQLEWGLGYIRASYATPCGAWAFWQSHNWY